ncbi:hypothetical protein DL768_003959 [Monosporascus sp. mg162]|nr:hypothetical protein DL768_003959 [Monosporascus sp. mg162]
MCLGIVGNSSASRDFIVEPLFMPPAIIGQTKSRHGAESNPLQIVSSERKIGCDRGYPACNNCVRTNRKCGGYGIRLAWPDQPDGRRRSSRLPSETTQSLKVESPHYGKQFLNVTYSDLAPAKNGMLPDNLPLIRVSRHRPRSISWMPGYGDKELNLMDYYQRMISSMISTIDIHNGFREDLLPMALSSASDASEGLRNAILALSSFHLAGSEEALPYKHKAIQSLSSSFSTDSVGISETQLATSMMLCVYSVFDETEGNWILHLSGAQKILYQLAKMRGQRLEYNFLYTWFLYHEVLGGFSRPLQYGREGPASLRLLDDANFDKSLIIGSLGCSVEVMEYISYVNGLRASVLRGESASFTPDEQAQRQDDFRNIESRLSRLVQRLDPHAAMHLSMREQVRIRTTAELYRIAAFLYLQRTCNTAHAEELRSIYMEEAFKALRSLEICTSPWPLFVVACETENDEQRIEILQILDRMENTRNIGNLLVLRNIIESYWNRKDLQADIGRSSDLKWWDVVDLQTSAPWFI